ncbi:hypothetical protein [Paenibacillus kobensis]|uniref:hypothetical protein n=1 Tax=Paenibacillus kobensis TaxID=59841 RepID=UPI000FD6D70F|nr:hypothetical protein [Paenibacillus kobensis]
MLKKWMKATVLTAALSLALAAPAFALPKNLDVYEPGNDLETTAPFNNQNVILSWIQPGGDLDYWRFVSPKTGLQEFDFFPPNGKNYAIGVYEINSGNPIAYSQSYGNYTSIFANLQVGKTYKILVFSADGSSDENTQYIIASPYLFPIS